MSNVLDLTVQLLDLLLKFLLHSLHRVLLTVDAIVSIDHRKKTSLDRVGEDVVALSEGRRQWWSHARIRLSY